MEDKDKLLHVILPTWPACIDCLSWSEDDLAVAGGEFVHILTPKTTSDGSVTTGHPQWEILSLRVNVFEPREWPEQIPITIDHLSLGEEISNCHVTALSWSQPGLGMHRRSVLAILTSNLVLSLWETDGGQATYKRTCVLNHHLTEDGSLDDSKYRRRAMRIRSFTWLPLLKTTVNSKWGTHYLAVTDDLGATSFFEISKTRTTTMGNWLLQIKLKLELGDLDTAKVNQALMSPLQRRLLLQSPITKIENTPWKQAKLIRPSDTYQGNTEDISVSQMMFKRGSITHTLHLCALTDTDSPSIALHSKSDLEKHGITIEEQRLAQSKVSTTRQRLIEQISAPAEYFKDATQTLHDDFNATYSLFGHYRTRFWGTAVSPDGSRAAACITLHPSDMIEYKIPSAEKSTLVVKNTGKFEPRLVVHRHPDSVIEKVLSVGHDSLLSGSAVDSLVDRQLLCILVSVAEYRLSPTSALRKSLEQLHDDMLTCNMIDPATHRSWVQQDDASIYHHSDPEKCDVCSATITFTSNTAKAKCSSGHQFSRCQLTFLAIQEPGISKYCSQCGKEFLDLAKLNPDDGSSFAQAMFDEFDVCPYCQAKYRG